VLFLGVSKHAVFTDTITVFPLLCRSVLSRLQRNVLFFRLKVHQLTNHSLDCDLKHLSLHFKIEARVSAGNDVTGSKEDLGGFQRFLP